MLYSKPNTTFEASLTGAPSGLVGTLGVQLLDTPAGTVMVARTTAGITEIPAGSGLYHVTLTAPATAGTYSVVWDTGGATPIYTSEELVVTHNLPTPLTTPTGWLISLNELKIALGKPLNVTTEDAKLEAAISAASQAILIYTDRDFGASNVTEARTFEYDGSGFLEIDDASAITEVSLAISNYSTVLTVDQWEAQPHRGPVYTYLLLPFGLLISSPAMGFKQNLDRYEPVQTEPTIATVIATWGYPTVPADVKQATIWTATSMSENPRPYTSESIADYSHSNQPQTSSTEAIPERARSLLEPYRRVFA